MKWERQIRAKTNQALLTFRSAVVPRKAQAKRGTTSFLLDTAPNQNLTATTADNVIA